MTYQEFMQLPEENQKIIIEKILDLDWEITRLKLSQNSKPQSATHPDFKTTN